MRKLKKIAKNFMEETWCTSFDSSSVSKYLTKNCLHQKTAGKSIGIESHIADCNDWRNAFPDFTAQIKRIETQGNLIALDIDTKGTHLGKFQVTNRNEEKILSVSDFSLALSNMQPTGLHYKNSCRLIFGFEKEKISLIIIEEKSSDEGAKQLGIKPLGLNFPQTDTLLESGQFILRALINEFNVFLTNEEIECLALGFCNLEIKQIEKILKIPLKTIKSHLKKTYQKFDCNNKQQVLDLMYESQILTLWTDLAKLLLMAKKQPPIF